MTSKNTFNAPTKETPGGPSVTEKARKEGKICAHCNNINKEIEKPIDKGEVSTKCTDRHLPGAKCKNMLFHKICEQTHRINAHPLICDLCKEYLVTFCAVKCNKNTKCKDKFFHEECLQKHKIRTHTIDLLNFSTM